ncbi:MAG TPA: hypothetical protein VFA71_06180 [Terriglobales bacterium]|nr:hypothetical protein [Terriglobales bacterium]
MVPQAQDLHRTIQLPIPEWLSQGERTEIPWTVALSEPVLTFQLRTVVRVTAEIDGKLLQKQGVMHQLHFIVKAAAENGEWDDEESYSSIRIDDRLINTELQMLADLYLKPGAYRVAIIVYDAISKKRNVSFSRVQIGEPDRDLFPGLLTGMPQITLLPPPDSTAPLARERVFLPVATQRPIQLDLIVDLSANYEPAGSLLLPRVFFVGRGSGLQLRFPSAGRPQHLFFDAYNQSLLLETASTLSGLDLKGGCMRIAVLDVPQHRMLLPFTAAREVDWDKMEDEIVSPKQATVSVATLQDGREAGRFFQEQIAQATTQSTSCKLGSPEALHVVAILSRGQRFTSGRKREKLSPECNCKVFYLRQTAYSSPRDDLKGMLKPLSPKVLQFNNPQQFREKLLEFTRALAAL